MKVGTVWERAVRGKLERFRHKPSLGIGFPDYTGTIRRRDIDWHLGRCKSQDKRFSLEGDWWGRLYDQCSPFFGHPVGIMHFFNAGEIEKLAISLRNKSVHSVFSSVTTKQSQSNMNTQTNTPVAIKPQNDILIPIRGTDVFVLDTTEKAIAMHDALSDYVIAPLGRVNHLQGLMTGISLKANNVDTNEGRLKDADFIKTMDFLNEQFPNHDLVPNCTYRGRAITSFYIYVMEGQEFKAFVFASATNNFVSYVLPGYSEKMIGFNEHFFDYLPPKKFTVHQFSAGGGMTPHTIEESDTVTHDEFYPYIEGGVKKLFTDFYESRSRVMILSGIPGTGKSSLMRAMVGHNTDKFVLLDDPSVYDNPEKFTEFMDSVRKMSLNERVTMFLEEADKILYEKKEGSGALERLLSLASGVIEHNIKIVIASNIEKVTDMYPALLRAGRAFRPLEFRDLSTDEAALARKAAGLEEVHFTTSVTLAGALNFDNVVGRKKQAIGFLPAGS